MRSDFAFHYAHRVRWVECDPQWVVFNGHYLTYFDVAITEYARAVGLPGLLVSNSLADSFLHARRQLNTTRPLNTTTSLILACDWQLGS